MLDNLLSKQDAIGHLRESNVIPKWVESGHPLECKILAENYSPQNPGNPETLWMPMDVPHKPSDAELAIRETYSRFHNCSVSRNKALKLIRKCFKKAGVVLDFAQLFHKNDVRWKNQLISEFFSRVEEGYYQPKAHFPFRFNRDSPAIEGLPVLAA